MLAKANVNGIVNDREALEDALLVTRCQLGEPSAFDDLIRRWHGPLWKYARRVAGDDDAAADTVQEVWLRVLRGIARLRDQDRFRAWMFGIARRVVMDRLRQKYAEPPVDSIEVLTDVESPDSQGIEQNLATLQDELAQLPVIERDVLVLFYLRELTLSELAEVLSVPIGTVKSRLFRARQLLRQKLTNKGVNR